MNSLLLPHRFKRIGWFILIPSIAIGLFVFSTDFETKYLDFNVLTFGSTFFESTDGLGFRKVNLSLTLPGIFLLVGAIFVAFSKEKNEDEYISNLRATSLLWAVFLNYAILLVSFIFVYGFSFFNVMVFNMFTVLIIFIARFNFLLFKIRK